MLGWSLSICPALAQNGIAAFPQSQTIVGTIGQGNLATVFTVGGLNAAGAVQNVKFKLVSISDNSDNFLRV